MNEKILKWLREHWTGYSVISEGWTILKFEAQDKDVEWLIKKLKETNNDR